MEPVPPSRDGSWRGTLNEAAWRGGTYPGQRALFAALVGAGGLGVAMDLTAMGVTIAQEGALPIGGPRLAESWAAVVLSSLVPAVLATLTSALGLCGARSVRHRRQVAQ